MPAVATATASSTALRIRADHDIEPSAIRQIRLGVLVAGARLVADPIEQKRSPRNPVDAQFSAPFATAVALVHGAAGAPQYVQEVVDDPRIRALMGHHRLLHVAPA